MFSPTSTLPRSLKFLSVMCLGTLLAACADLGIQSEGTYTNKEKENIYKGGSVLGENGGFDVLGGDSSKDKTAAGMTVNAFLWRATLDTVSFMPIMTADPFGGVITTDWYSSPATPEERARLNVFILDRDLRADGVKVTVFRQERDKNMREWKDVAVSPETAAKLETTILTRARQMKLSQRERE